MPRGYVEHADDLPVLRGRLDVTRQFTMLAAEPSRLACRYDTLTADIALNRIMKAAIARLACIAQSADNQHRLRELAFALCRHSARTDFGATLGSGYTRSHQQPLARVAQPRSPAARRSIPRQPLLAERRVLPCCSR
jgi:hypothetical protein